MEIEVTEKICGACNNKRLLSYNGTESVCPDCSDFVNSGEAILLSFIESVAQLPHWLSINAQKTLEKYRKIKG